MKPAATAPARILPHAPAANGGPVGAPLLRLAFRPFYTLAAAAAVVLMLLWGALGLGVIGLRSGLSPPLWHGHEMLFGFVAAAVVGFLLTAGKVWTGLSTPRGLGLGLLAALWLGARVTALTGPRQAFVALDILFLPIAAAVLLSVVLRSRNWRNLRVGGVLLLLALANGWFHLADGGWVQGAAELGLDAGIAVMVLLMSLIGGRVIPAFTLSAVPGLKLRTSRAGEAVMVLLTASGLALWLGGWWPALSSGVLALAAVAQAARWWSWRPWVSRSKPLLWVLHLSYAWLPVGLALLAASQAGWVATGAARHALTVGAMGGLILGMMTRTARGHTGRFLHASPDETCAYALVFLAAVARVAAPLLPGPWLTPMLWAAGALWVVAFSLYLLRFTPWLFAARVDGRDG